MTLPPLPLLLLPFPLFPVAVSRFLVGDVVGTNVLGVNDGELVVGCIVGLALAIVGSPVGTMVGLLVEG